MSRTLYLMFNRHKLTRIPIGWLLLLESLSQTGDRGTMFIVIHLCTQWGPKQSDSRTGPRSPLPSPLSSLPGEGFLLDCGKKGPVALWGCQSQGNEILGCLWLLRHTAYHSPLNAPQGLFQILFIFLHSLASWSDNWPSPPTVLKGQKIPLSPAFNSAF